MISKRYIYCLKHPITGEIRYIGKTKNPSDRYKDHLRSFKKVLKGINNQWVSRWINKLNKEGLQPKMKILLECNIFNVNFCEIELISHYKQFCKLTNLTKGGDGADHSEETRNKISQRMKGNKYNLGKKYSKERKEFISERMKGNNNPKRKNMIPVYQYDLDNNLIKKWISGEDAGKNLNISSSSINRCCNNKKSYLTAGGFIWKLKEGEVINVL